MTDGFTPIEEHKMSRITIVDRREQYRERRQESPHCDVNRTYFEHKCNECGQIKYIQFNHLEKVWCDWCHRMTTHLFTDTGDTLQWPEYVLIGTTIVIIITASVFMAYY